MRKLTLLLPVALITACTVNVVNPVGVGKVVVNNPDPSQGLTSTGAKPLLAPMDAEGSTVESSEVIADTPEPTPQPTPRSRSMSFIPDCLDWTDISDNFHTALVNVDGIAQEKEVCSEVFRVYASGGISCNTAKWSIASPIKDGVFMTSDKGERCLTSTAGQITLNIEKSVSSGSFVINVEYETATASLRFDIDRQSENGPIMIRGRAH